MSELVYVYMIANAHDINNLTWKLGSRRRRIQRAIHRGVSWYQASQCRHGGAWQPLSRPRNDRERGDMIWRAK